MDAIWKKEAKIYNNFFKLLTEKKLLLSQNIQEIETVIEYNKRITLNNAIQSAIKSILTFEYAVSNLEDRYLYVATMYHSEQSNFQSTENFVLETEKIHKSLKNFSDLIKLESDQIKKLDMNFTEIYTRQLEYIKSFEQDNILTFARLHLEDSFAKVRDFWTTIAQRITPPKITSTETLFKTNEYEIVKEAANAPIGKFYRYTKYRNGIAKAYITGYVWPTGSFYISLLVNPYNNKSISTKNLGNEKSSNPDDHNAYFDLIEIYRFLEEDAKRMGLKHLTTLCIPQLTEFVITHFKYKKTGWKDKAFMTPFEYLVKRL